MARRSIVDITTLRAVVADKQTAHVPSGRPNIMWLMGRFHTWLVRLAGNRPLANNILETAIMTMLTIFVCLAPHTKSCYRDEFKQVIDAIECQLIEHTTELILNHLDQIEVVQLSTAVRCTHRFGWSAKECLIRPSPRG